MLSRGRARTSKQIPSHVHKRPHLILVLPIDPDALQLAACSTRFVVPATYCPKSVALRTRVHDEQQGPVHSFIQILHEAPRLMELLPAAAAKNLSAACRSLRTSFRQQVKVIHFNSTDTSKLCCETWPQLVMVTCDYGSSFDRHLSAQWECLLDMSVESAHSRSAWVIKPHQQLHVPMNGLSSQYCAALSAFAVRHRHTATGLVIHGPLVGCRVVQSLTDTYWPLLHSMSVTGSSHLGREGMRLCAVQSLL